MADSPEAIPTTHERLLDTARVLFAERGYLGASMNDIAQRVGIRKPSLYNYYRSKDALFLDLLERSLDAWRAATRPVLSERRPFAERLERHLQAMVDFAIDHPHDVAICRLAVTQLTGPIGRRVHEQLNAQSGEYREALRTRFVDAIEAGEVRRAPVDDLVVAWLAFLDGILFHIAFELDAQRDIPARLGALWSVFWHGLSPGEATT